jgi:phage tail-like protein
MPEPAGKEPNAASGAAPGAFVDPYRAYSFKLLIQGVTQGHFTQCSGLGIKVDAIQYREGTGITHFVAGQPEYTPVTLQYGVTDSRELWDWITASVNGKVDRKTIQLLMMDSDGITEKLRYSLKSAFPIQWSAASLDAGSSLIAIEKMTFVYEGVQRG